MDSKDNGFAKPDVAMTESQRAEVMKELHKRSSMLMDELKRLFVPEMKLTMIMRHTTDPECYSILTEDDINEVRKFIMTAKDPSVPFVGPAAAPATEDEIAPPDGTAA